MIEPRAKQEEIISLLQSIMNETAKEEDYGGAKNQDEQISAAARFADLYEQRNNLFNRIKSILDLDADFFTPDEAEKLTEILKKIIELDSNNIKNARALSGEMRKNIKKMRNGLETFSAYQSQSSTTGSRFDGKN